MDKAIYFITLEQVLIIHEDQIDRYGGSHGIRDLNLLESALFRPQTTFSGEDLYITIFDKAVALMHSFVLNNPFIDGNKRTAVVSVIVFLSLNGWKLKIPQKELVKTVLAIEAKKFTPNHYPQLVKERATQIARSKFSQYSDCEVEGSGFTISKLANWLESNSIKS